MRRFAPPCATPRPSPRCSPRRNPLATAVTGLMAGVAALAAHAEPSTLLQGLPSLSLSSATAGASPQGAEATQAPRASAQTAAALSASFDPDCLQPPAAGRNSAGGTARKHLAPRVLILTMFEPETQVWQQRLGPWTRTRIAGLPDGFPWLRCNAAQVCLATIGMGHANAAASAQALVLSGKLDLRQTYILVTGMAAINPEQGTLGTPAWARFLVDFGLQWQIDAREAPSDWPGGYLGINTRHPKDKPELDYETEVFQVDGALLRKAVALSREAELADHPSAQAARARYPSGPASQPPQVTQCDTVSADTWFSGRLLGERASTWTQTLTNGAGNYCTAQQEDNATFEGLQRGARLGRVDLSRVLVLRAGADFDRPPPGVSAAANLLNYTAQGGFDLALDNLYRAALPVVKAISTDWRHWQRGVPQ